jgi:hypothetical protein
MSLRLGTMRTAGLLSAAALGCGCGGGGEQTVKPDPYASDSMWLCRAGMVDDQCLKADLDATEILPDNSLNVVPHVAAPSPEYDCFYVYPTVDLTITAGNVQNLSDITPMLTPLLSQAARFNTMCRIFAPLYHQATIGVFISQNQEPYLDVAYKDVSAAFRYYLDHHAEGRNLVIMGHSQGAFMTRRLIQEFVENDPDLKARFIAGLLLGGDITVKKGEATGGSFTQIPLCTNVAETGCVIAYRSYAKGYPPQESPVTKILALDPTLDAACTNPGALEGGPASFAMSYIPLGDTFFGASFDPGLPITTSFAFYRDFYAGQCAQDAQGISYMEVSNTPATGDQREDLIPYGEGLFSPAPPFGLGLHILDYNLALGDLMDVVAQKAAAMPQK